MPVCIFKDCLSGSKKKSVNRDNSVHLHRFPKNANLRLMWLQQIEYGQSINRNSINLETGSIFIIN